MTKVNTPLFRKAVEWAVVEAKKPKHQSEWHQGSYVWHEDVRKHWYLTYGEVTQEQAASCGTAYCIAGYVGQMLDERFMRSNVVGDVHVGDFAEEQLGLTSAQSEALFDGGNEIETIVRLFEEFTGEKL